MRWKTSRSSGKPYSSRNTVGTRISVGSSVRVGSSTTNDAPATADVLRTPRRGTSSRARNQRTRTRTGTRNRHHCSGDASFTRSEDPYTSILTTHRAKVRWWGADGGIAVGQTHESGRNQHRGHQGRTECGSSRDQRSGNGGSMARQKRKEVEASVPTRIMSPGLVARTSL